MEEKIINLFAYDEKLSFNQIKNKLKIRSNKLAYWLTKLVKTQILTKEKGAYALSESTEHLVPYLSKNKSMLAVVLIHIGNRTKALLYERKKRPYKGLRALPGGRILIGESPQDAAKRIMHTKYNLLIKKPRIQNILIEHIKKKKVPLYSFLLIIITAEITEPAQLTNLEENKRTIIPSDYQILTRKGKEQKLDTIISTI